jgi:hypothetical protein
MTVIAIDFGTSNTAIAILEVDGDIITAKTLHFGDISHGFETNGEKAWLVPSLVYVLGSDTGKREFLFGELARSQNQLKKEQLQAVLNYIHEKKVCKNKLILNYFGEKTAFDCGICSFCIPKKSKKKDSTALSQEIISLLKAEDLNSRDLQNRTKNNPEEVIFVLQELLEKNIILVQPNNKYTLRS